MIQMEMEVEIAIRWSKGERDGNIDRDSYGVSDINGEKGKEVEIYI